MASRAFKKTPLTFGSLLRSGTLQIQPRRCIATTPKAAPVPTRPVRRPVNSKLSDLSSTISKSASTSAPSSSGQQQPSNTNATSQPTSQQVPKQSPATAANKVDNLSKSGLSDSPFEEVLENDGTIDWTRSYHGLSAQPFSKEAADVLLAETPAQDVEIKPDGIVYLPEIKYRRILNKAFGPGGWGLVPRGESIVTAKMVTREYALVAHGRLVSVARGEQDYFSPDGIPTATEGCKSNAMMR
ncbi:hypothetical protein KEM55_008757, partial [Ascosphaera atra]